MSAPCKADQGSSVGSIGLLLSVFGASALATRLLIGSTFRAWAVRLTIAIGGLASSAALILITTTSSTTLLAVLIGINGVGWGVLSTVLLTLLISGKGHRSPAAVIGFYVGIEGVGRTVAPVLAGILEFDGERVWGGEEDGETVAHVSPGLRMNPLADHDFAVGTGVSIPITNDEEFDLRWIVSIFYHF